VFDASKSSFQQTIINALILGTLVFAVLLVNGFPNLLYPDVAGKEPYFANLVEFSYEFGGNDWRKPELWIDNWFFHQPPPYQYRILGKFLLYPVFQLLNAAGLDRLNALYFAHVFWCAALLTGLFAIGGQFLSSFWRTENSFLHVHWTGATAGFGWILGAVLLVVSPPILFAMHFPVHGGVNELAGYLLILLSLRAMMLERPRELLLWLVLSVFCRETNLILLLPLVLNSGMKLQQRFLYPGIVVGIFLLYRSVWPGHYDPFGGAAHNWKFPLESIAFMFLIFGPFWLTGIAGQVALWRTSVQFSPTLRALNRSFFPLLVGVLLIIWFLARVREIRIGFILFPWILGGTLFYLANHWRNWLGRFRDVFLWVILAIAAVATFKLHVALSPESIQEHRVLYSRLAHFYSGHGGGWIRMILPYAFFSVVVACLLLWDSWEALFVRKD
jgi:hypothetical protein